MKSIRETITEGNELRTKRKLMRLKQVQLAKLLETEQGNYCRMEQGRLNCGNRIFVVRDLFNDWRDKEIVKLEKRIDYLKKL